MITLLKLGGSLITDKNIPRHFRRDVIQRLASEIGIVRESSPEHLIIGHGSGSFGHVEAKKYNTMNGVTREEDWLGFVKVAQAASQLSQLIFTEFVGAELPVMRFQPSASILANGGIIQSMNTDALVNALNHKLIPLIHGDVAFDIQRGGTIVSTETIFTYLVQTLKVDRIILLGEVDGVLDSNGKLIPTITPDSVTEIKSVLGGSDGVDVTGGMYQKVMDMLKLIATRPELEIIIANGKTPDLLIDIIRDRRLMGTKIFAG